MKMTHWILALLLCLLPSLAAAIPTVTITDGFIQTGLPTDFQLWFDGPGLSVRGNLYSQRGLACCGAFVHAEAGVTWQGVLFEPADLDDELPAYSELNAIHGPLLCGPVECDGQPAPWSSTAPFTLDGILYNREDLSQAIHVVGAGLLTAERTGWASYHYLYTFTHPVPELETVWLVGLALAGLTLATAWRRRI